MVKVCFLAGQILKVFRSGPIPSGALRALFFADCDVANLEFHVAVGQDDVVDGVGHYYAWGSSSLAQGVFRSPIELVFVFTW